MKPIIYTTPTCSYCHALMDWLDQQGIIYEEKNYADPAIAADLEKQLGHELDVVPTTIIGNTVISGFKRPAIKRALAKHAKNP